MFHYRPALSGRRIRLYIAFFLAIAAHAGLMGLHVDRVSLHAPQVSFPRSVSVFLIRNYQGDSPAAPRQERQEPGLTAKEETRRVPQEERQVFAKEPVAQKKAVSEGQPPVTHQSETRTANEHLPEKGRATMQEDTPPLEALEALHAVAGQAAEAAEADEAAGPPAGMEAGEAQQAGKLQTAYPRYRVNAPPVYPGLARKRGQEGTVILQVLVNSQGRVDDLQVETSSGFALLDRAAATAVRTWLFEPGRRGAEKVQMRVRVPVNFKLEQ